MAFYAKKKSVSCARVPVQWAGALILKSEKLVVMIMNAESDP